MLAGLAPNITNRTNNPVSPFLEMGAYEHLWIQPKTTFKSLSDKFTRFPGSVPSNFVPNKEDAYTCANIVRNRFAHANVGWFGVQINGVGEYP